MGQSVSLSTSQSVSQSASQQPVSCLLIYAEGHRVVILGLEPKGKELGDFRGENIRITSSLKVITNLDFLMRVPPQRFSNIT